MLTCPTCSGSGASQPAPLRPTRGRPRGDVTPGEVVGPRLRVLATIHLTANKKKRRYECTQCSAKWTTYEVHESELDTLGEFLDSNVQRNEEERLALLSIFRVQERMVRDNVATTLRRALSDLRDATEAALGGRG